jgi:hypothetical protein
MKHSVVRLQTFRIWYHHFTKEERHSTCWDYKAKLCRMLGYDGLSRDCYKILTVLEGEILRRKEVILII